VSNAVGFLNGPWAQLANEARCGRRSVSTTLQSCVEALEWPQGADQLGFAQWLLGEINMVLTALSLTELHSSNKKNDSRELAAMLSRAEESHSHASIRGLELIPTATAYCLTCRQRPRYPRTIAESITVQELNRNSCKFVTNFRCPWDCRAQEIRSLASRSDGCRNRRVGADSYTGGISLWCCT
jgi:hypothetical protein